MSCCILAVGAAVAGDVDKYIYRAQKEADSEGKVPESSHDVFDVDGFAAGL